MAEEASVNLATSGNEGLGVPQFCGEAADRLGSDSRFCGAGAIFRSELIDKSIEKLMAYDYRELWTWSAREPREVERLLRQYLHQGRFPRNAYSGQASSSFRKQVRMGG
jgi:hypothetical protein